ncbi:hypothetical protein HERIO_1108 [Hepatospora eriocheir]|uniref:Uncharacterized protein n=1 Tax=Hepatospora eriocheir TaxID=1081669 RepID=A0A1X0QB15_9MICR|nr:hypothetical protein HERIO_1108 [Hepatospora eriocheir]
MFLLLSSDDDGSSKLNFNFLLFFLGFLLLLFLFENFGEIELSLSFVTGLCFLLLSLLSLSFLLLSFLLLSFLLLSLFGNLVDVLGESSFLFDK